MIRWLRGIIQRAHIKTQRDEMVRFLEGLKGMDDEEVGFIVAVATDQRHMLESIIEAPLLDPLVAVTIRPSGVMAIHQAIRQFQAAGAPHIASGTMVWLFSWRATKVPELRLLGRQMWSELIRGIPHAPLAAEGYFANSGHRLNLDGYRLCPVGLEPR